MKKVINKPKYFVILMLVTTLLIQFSVNGLCQDSRDLSIEIQPKVINGDDFDGVINLFVKNISRDTVFIITQPFNYDIIGNSDRINLYVSYWVNTISPNRVVFIKKNSDYSSASGGSSISFIKFPNILYLPPGEQSKIVLTINQKVISDLKNSCWDVKLDLWYSFKSDYDSVLMNKSLEIKEEYYKSLYKNDIIKLCLTDKKQPFTSDSLVYFNTRERSSDRYYIGKESVYDSILKYFGRLFM